MIASRFRGGFRWMATLAIDYRLVGSKPLTVPKRIGALPKNTSKFKHDHSSALGIQFFGASSPAEIVSGWAPDSGVSALLRPWLLPNISGAVVRDEKVVRSFAGGSTELDFLLQLGRASQTGMPETATHDLSHALLHAAGFQAHSTVVCTQPKISVDLGTVGDALHLRSVPDHAVEARWKRKFLIVNEAKRESQDEPEVALPQLAGDVVCAAVQDYLNWGTISSERPVFGLRFWGARLLAARFDFPAAYLNGLLERTLEQTVAVPLWGGPPASQAIATDSVRWGLDLCDADQRKEAFQLLTAIAREVAATAAGTKPIPAAGAQVVDALAFKSS